MTEELPICKVWVATRQSCHKTAKRNGAKCIVSLTDLDKRLYVTPYLSECDILSLKFEDVINPEHYGAPKLHHIKKIIDWFETVPDDEPIVVHCEAGISRSTATAFYFLYRRHLKRYEGNVEAALEAAEKDLLHVRKWSSPNPLMNEYFGILGGGGNLYFRAANRLTSALALDLYKDADHFLI